MRPKGGELTVLGGSPCDPKVRARVGFVPLGVVLPDVLRVDETLALAREIASASATVVGIGKAAFYAQIDLDQASAYDYTKRVMTANALESDAHEGISAFLEKRAPKW